MSKREKKNKFLEHLSLEDKKKAVDSQLDIYKSAAERKMAILPQTAALTATLIIVATLNKNLVPINLIESKVLLSLLLFLVPFALHIYAYDIEKSGFNAVKSIKSYLGDEIFKDIEKNKSFIDKVVAYSPISIIIIFDLIILFLIFKIWIDLIM